MTVFCWSVSRVSSWPQFTCSSPAQPHLNSLSCVIYSYTTHKFLLEMHSVLRLHAWLVYFLVFLLVNNQLLFKIYYMYLTFQWAYSQYLVFINKAMVSILITWRWLISTTNKLLLVKKKLTGIIFTAPTTCYHSPVSSSATSLLSYALEAQEESELWHTHYGHLNYDSSELFIPNGAWSPHSNVSNINVWLLYLGLRTFSFSSYSWCHIHFVWEMLLIAAVEQ